jgi:autotransporter strand-loop-strand O-heptosyltransferase
MPLKVRLNAPVIGTTGFNNHARNLIKELIPLRQVEVRNYSIGDSWTGLSDEPHNQEPYLEDWLKQALVLQSLWKNSAELTDHPIYTKWPNSAKPDIDIVLGETGHAYFYNDYLNYSIAYNVWEATLQPKDFFNRLLQFDELWVPSHWQKAHTIKQGYPADRIFVVPEGVDTEIFEPAKDFDFEQGKFRFLIVGRWEARKYTTEMIEAFLKAFPENDRVELLVSADNPFAAEGSTKTADCLKQYGFDDPRIKPISFQSTSDYAKLLREAHVFLSCSRSEGWNLPLLEAMASGVPSIYSDESGQLEFAKGRGLPVKITHETPAIGFPDCGNWYEPDPADLVKVIGDAYSNWAQHKQRALIEAAEVREQFSWQRSAQIANDRLEAIKEIVPDVNRSKIKADTITYNAIRGAFLEIIQKDPGEYLAEFIDRSTGAVEFSQKIENNMWIRSSRSYYIDWGYRITDLKSGETIMDESLVLKDNRVMVSIESKSLGDNLAWLPAVEEFRLKHGCRMVCSTFWNRLFAETYPQIEFVEPGQPITNIAAHYAIGWYYDENDLISKTANPKEVKTQPMQKTAFDILGLDYKEIRPRLVLPKAKRGKKIAIAIHGTCQAKYWNNPTGWQDVVDWCSSEGYEVVLLSAEPDNYMGNARPKGVRTLPHGPIEGVIDELMTSAAFVGIGSGLTWLSWATGTPTVLVSGFSEGYTEMQGISRVGAPAGKCSGCFNSHRLDPSDWNWCPVNKGSNRQFECSKTISSESVIAALKQELSRK